MLGAIVAKAPWKVAGVFSHRTTNLCLPIAPSSEHLNIICRFKTSKSTHDKDLQSEEKSDEKKEDVKSKGKFTFNKKDLESEQGMWKVFARWKKHYRVSRKRSNGRGQSSLTSFLA